jgi:Recombination endonuclease VII
LYGSSRHYHLKRRYGIGATEVEHLIGAQGDACAICDRPHPQHVDHDHATGLVRGILCFNCNGGLGQFGDDPERLYRAAFYLEDIEQRPADISRLVDAARQRAAALREIAA